MFRKRFGLCLIGVFSLLHIGVVSAATLSFDPSNQTVGLGDPVSVDLRISGLCSDDSCTDKATRDILSAFDLNVGFDDSILSFQSFTFGTGLDTFGFGSIQIVDDSVVGLVNVFELSFDSDADLKSRQPNDFVLGTFNFNTLSLGTSPLNIALNFGIGLVGADALTLQAELQTGTVSVVPVPAAVWLFGTGLVGLIGFSKRRKVLRQ